MDMSDFVPMLAATGGVAALTEAVVQACKQTVPQPLSPRQDRLLALGCSLVLALVLVRPGLSSLWANLPLQILAGVLAARGSNFVHDLTNLLGGFSSEMKVRGNMAEQFKQQQAGNR